MKNYLVFLLLLIVFSCKNSININLRIIDAVRNRLHAVQVTVTDINKDKGSENTKNILVDMGKNGGGRNADVLTDAYQTVTAAYQAEMALNDKLPAIYTIQIKVNGVTNGSFIYHSAYLGKSTALEQKIKGFMDAVIGKRYNNLTAYMEPGLDLSPIIIILKNAELAGDGVISYQFISLQHGTGIHNPDKKPMSVIQGWVLITGKASNRQYPMLFIANPATGQLSSIYINPSK